MTESKKPNHQNIFESYIAQDIFMLDIFERITHDWKTSHRKQTFNRENFEEFITNDFMQWIELELEEFCDDEFEFDEFEDGEQE